MAHWDNQAKQWELIGAPLKPSLVDIQNSSKWINEIISTTETLSVLVLGVTPELINIAWPAHTQLFAIDINMEMIKKVLPTGKSDIKPLAINSNWLHLPFSDSSIDIVIGDGCYSSLASNDYLALSKEISRALKPTGMLIMRFFSRQDNDSIESIKNDIASLKIDSFHNFKLRLAMALQEDIKKGICLKNIWEIWSKHFKEYIQTYTQQLSWKEAVINTINIYKESNVRYTFPTLNEIRSALCHDFTEKDIFFPDYPLGPQCPTLKLTPIK